jgi:hypothetical protein
MSSFDQYQDIINTFEDVLSALNILCGHIHDELSDYPVWIMQEDAFKDDSDKLIYALIYFSPVSSLSPQETWTCPGAVAGTKKTIALIKAVNHAKDTFKQKAEACKTIFKANPTKPVRDILARNGHGGIKLKQVYRHIRYIEHQPLRIAWSKGKASSNVIITIEQAREMLIKIGEGEHIDIQLAKLNLLKPTEKLVKRRHMKPYWVINITSSREAGHTPHRKIATSLPLFYLQESEHKRPTVCLSKKTNRDNTKARADKQIEEIPFLQSISVYRYK